ETKVPKQYNPGKALRLGLVIPGGGQIHNQRWWKLPLVYGAYTGLYLTIDFNQGLYVRFRDALEAKLNDELHEFSGTSFDDVTTLRSLRDRYDKNTQLSYIGAVVAHGLIALEAFIDAHLRDFDISDDLSLKLKPSIQLDPVSLQPVANFGMVVEF
ncbi:MAG: DUF5683 domain-containing protein, partial [Bacteroidota bacterium]